MSDLKQLMEDQTLKPAFDKAKELGAIDLYSDSGAKKFFEGKAKVAFVSEVLFNGETLKEKQARLIQYDIDFTKRQEGLDISKMKFASEEQRQKYIESCRDLEISCKKSLALFRKRYKDAEIIEQSIEKGDMLSYFIERPVYDEKGEIYTRAIDCIAFYCHPDSEEKMLNIVKEQEAEWLSEKLVTAMSSEDESVVPNLKIEKLIS